MFHARVHSSSARALNFNELRLTRQGTAPLSEAHQITNAFDLVRPVYCVLGLPIDAVSMADVIRRVEGAAVSKTRCLISTPNLDFLVQTLSDTEFREALLHSDLCTADGMPIVWIARLFGIPIRNRVSGSDLLEALKVNNRGGRPTSVFLFGGKDDIAARAGTAINASSDMLRCVGTLNPGFGSIQDMSRPQVIDIINGSGADFVVASLGSTKGQLWLHRNQASLTVPVRAHLGAALAFSAGSIRRAPRLWRNAGLEWLWRIKEEPYLWRRYAHDASVLTRLLFLNVLPLAIWNGLRRLAPRGDQPFVIKSSLDGHSATVHISGEATKQNIAETVETLDRILLSGTAAVTLQMAEVRWIDARFFGLLLMLRKALRERQGQLALQGLSPALRRLFRLNRASFLLGP